MAELEELLEEVADEVQEAGFRDLRGLGEALEQVLAARADQLMEAEAEALQLAADVLHSLDRALAPTD
ncbi:MAG: hypothetical protein HY690_17325 [Chloroflexi bacterium]|nr:hypothetical protein [Chloroflexota bacterium]